MQALHRKAQDDASRCLVTWAEDVMRMLATGAGLGHASQVYFAPGNACHKALLGCLHDACSSLDICVFTITDDRITDHIRRARSRGVSIRIITDNEKAWDPGSDIYDLADSGFQVCQDSSPEHMHHKFVLVDDRKVITGSFNWTKGSSRNYENILICDDLQVASAYRQEFDRLWKIMRRV